MTGAQNTAEITGIVVYNERGRVHDGRGPLPLIRGPRILADHTDRGNLLNATSQQIGYLIINLGTPDSPTVPDVRRYLNEFLMDPYVIAVPWLIRRLLVSLVILPTRPKNSAHAYQQIWDERGSPLLFHSDDLRSALAEQLQAPVALGMRYGNPSIEHAVNELKSQGVTKIVVAPLYPQFADSTTTTCLEHIQQFAHGLELTPLPPFYDDPAFVAPLAKTVSASLPDQWDHLLLSYHGLPERALTKTDPTGQHCLSENCCEKQSPAHATCYRHQAFATSQALAKHLKLEADQYTVSFQSRLGRLPWLRPYTDEVLAELPTRGVKHLVVACPAFVADNLETLEEIGMQGQETFQQAGGETFTLVPCLNATPEWVAGLATLLSNSAQTLGANAQTSV